MFQGTAVRERVCPDAFYGVGYRDAFQGYAAPKASHLNAVDRPRNLHMLQSTAAAKCVVSDAGHGVWNRDAFQGSAGVKGFVLNCDD